MATPETTLSWDDSVWFSDIDDTLIDTAGASEPGSMGVKVVFENHFDEDIADDVQSHFNGVFNLVLAGYRVHGVEDWAAVPGGKTAFDEVMSYIESCQQQVKADYGHAKKWSREIFVKYAADQVGIAVTPEIVHEAADAYWFTLTERVMIFPDALTLTRTIHEHHRPLFLVTSSDARLKMQNDGQFIYEPTYSEALKRQRIELLRNRGLYFNTVSIGDPEDKPHLDFFTKAVHLARAELGVPVNLRHAIMMGDSYPGDLQTPKEQMGFGLVVLRQKGRTVTEVTDRQITTGTLQVLNDHIR